MGRMGMKKTFAALVVLVTASVGVVVGAAPAQASITTYVSVLQPSGTIGPKVIDIKDASTADLARAQLWQWRSTDTANQRWTIWQQTTVGNYGAFMLKNVKSGKCLDMATDVPEGNGVRVQQYTCNYQPNQLWWAVPVATDWSKGWVELVNLKSWRCLDATGATYVDGAPLQVWGCGGGWNQRWNIS
jgi:hypothetical protein